MEISRFPTNKPTLYGDGLILSPKTTCPRFSEGALSDPA